ncbi:MAG: dihydroneopterin aldolase [Spirochaetota bacterium]|nr:dihydroneopterin aldolase [Spirochaetota bacterium]
MIIRIKNLHLKGIIGIYEQEKLEPQDIVVNVEMDVDVQKAVISDNIADTIDYDGITERITELVAGSEYNLLETLAQKMLDIVMEDYRVLKGRVEVDKPQAIPRADSVSLCCEAKR